MIRTSLVVLLLVLMTATLASADMVQLRDGRVLRGEIKSYDNVNVTLSIAGRDYTIPSNQVVNLSYADEAAPAVPQYAYPYPVTTDVMTAPAWNGYPGDVTAVPFYGVGELYGAPRRLIISGERANIRRGPGMEYTVITQVTRDQVFMTVGETASWFRLVLPDGSQAWVSKSLARIIEPTEAYNTYGYGYGNPYMANSAYPGMAYGNYGQAVIPAAQRELMVKGLAQRIKLSLSADEIAQLVDLLQ